MAGVCEGGATKMGQFESVAGKSKNKNPATEGQRGGVLGGFKEAIRNVAKC